MIEIDLPVFECCKWCNGTGNDGTGICPDCESTGHVGGKYADEMFDISVLQNAIIHYRGVVQKFIDEHRYTYQVDTIVDEYKNKFGKYYVSYTMNHCCKSLSSDLDHLIQYENELEELIGKVK